MNKSNKYLYYKKDKKVKLISKSNGEEDSNGFQEITYKYISNKTFWAYTSQLSQEQIYSLHAYGQNETRLFVLNYRNDLKLYDFIEYKGKYYSITRLDTEDDYNGELYIYVKDATPGDTPRDIQPADD